MSSKSLKIVLPIAVLIAGIAGAVPLIIPGVISGALFAFITSFDEVVVVLFVGSYNQRTIPWQMFSGIREQISPTIMAVATILIMISISLLVFLELMRRRSERLRGITPH